MRSSWMSSNVAMKTRQCRGCVPSPGEGFAGGCVEGLRERLRGGGGRAGGGVGGGWVGGKGGGGARGGAGGPGLRYRGQCAASCDRRAPGQRWGRRDRRNRSAQTASGRNTSQKCNITIVWTPRMSLLTLWGPVCGPCSCPKRTCWRC